MRVLPKILDRLPDELIGHYSGPKSSSRKSSCRLVVRFFPSRGLRGQCCFPTPRPSWRSNFKWQPICQHGSTCWQLRLVLRKLIWKSSGTVFNRKSIEQSRFGSTKHVWECLVSSARSKRCTQPWMRTQIRRGQPLEPLLRLLRISVFHDFTRGHPAHGVASRTR